MAFFRVCSHCAGNDIIFIILVPSNVAVTNEYYGNKWMCAHGNDIFKTQNYRCFYSVNKVLMIEFASWNI